jgi:broad-specificity NMP kinase
LIVHLNGWPGVGKKTIGRILAERLGARFIHNHVLHDVAIVCAGFDGPDRWALYETVRAAAYDALARRPATEPFVMTNGLCVNAPRERKAWGHIVELAMARNAPLVPVVLHAEIDELARRVASNDRVGAKLSDAVALRDMVATDTLQRPAVDELIEIDVTRLSAAQAAEEIATRLRALGPLAPATPRHLEMR